MEEDALVTDIACLLDIDLYRATVSDLDFVSKFVLTARKKDFVHALLVWFDAQCTKTQEVV